MNENVNEYDYYNVVVATAVVVVVVIVAVVDVNDDAAIAIVLSWTKIEILGYIFNCSINFKIGSCHGHGQFVDAVHPSMVVVMFVLQVQLVLQVFFLLMFT